MIYNFGLSKQIHRTNHGYTRAVSAPYTKPSLEVDQGYINYMNRQHMGVQFLNKNRWRETRPISSHFIDQNQIIDEKNMEKSETIKDAIKYTSSLSPTKKTILNSNIGLENVFIVSNIFGGGSLKYKNDLIHHYKNIEFRQIKTKSSIYKRDFSPNDVIFVQQLLFTDIDPADIIYIKEKYNSKLVISVHDFCWFVPNMTQDLTTFFYHKNYLLNELQIYPEIKKLFQVADLVIHPSEFTLKEYNNKIPHSNGKIVHHNDYFVDYSTKNIPEITDDTINIGCFHEYSEYKGMEMIEKIQEEFSKYKKYKIQYFVSGFSIPLYNEMEDFEDQLKKYNIHFFLLLNKWGETYCYSLTKYINSGLPFLYNNFGAYKERIPKNVDHYVSVFENETDINNTDLLFLSFTNMLEYVIERNGKYSISNLSKEIVYKNEYNYLFGGEINFTGLHKMVKPFCVYFPQFHKLKENDVNYYTDMTDVSNLSIYQLNEPDSHMQTPCLKTFHLSKMKEYDLTNHEILQKQVDVALEYGIYGFAIYYYWFSLNSVTKKHVIMDECYNNFFNGKVNLPHNFRIYFIWANEDWSGNPAFNTDEKIYNVYDVTNFQKNIYNLIQYFKHEYYYKIEDKPVFYVHHPWLIPDNVLAIFYKMLNHACIENGFAGVHLVVNNMVKSYNVINNYNFYPDYKKNKTLDYNEYAENISIKNPCTKCIFFHFDNRPRLYIPNKLDKASVYYNNTYDRQCFVLEKILEQYKEGENEREEIDKIFLINSWNEWGEQMAIEPSNERGFSFLNLLKFKFFRYL